LGVSTTGRDLESKTALLLLYALDLQNTESFAVASRNQSGLARHGENWLFIERYGRASDQHMARPLSQDELQLHADNLIYPICHRIRSQHRECLLERVGAGSPPGQEQRQSNGLEDAGKSTNGDGVERAFLSGDLSDERWRRAGQEDQGAEVCGALVAEGPGGIDERTNTVRLEGAADEGGAPRRGGRGRLLRADELFLGVGRLGAVVSVAKDGAQDGKGGDVVEGGAQGDGRRLDGWEVVERHGG